MVYRLYVEKKPGFDHEAHALLSEINSFLGITNLILFALSTAMMPKISLKSFSTTQRVRYSLSLSLIL